MSYHHRQPFVMHLAALVMLLTALVACAAPSAAPATQPAQPTAAPQATSASQAAVPTAAAQPAATSQPAAPVSGAKPAELRLDYAYYNPSSLVLRKFGWLEDELKAQNISVKWVLSTGSNKANEYLLSNSVDFGSTAGSAALLARANGSPIKTVYIYSKPEWTALVVGKASTITDPKQLKGKKIAATKGTDPYFFLLRTLHANGMTASDVEIVNLQHPDGRIALERGQVDAWAGLDPHMAASEIDNGSKIIYRNIDFNTYGFLNAREEFLRQYPDLTQHVLADYERARNWILANPDDAAQILANEAQISLPVAKRELVDRTVLKIDPVPGPTQVAVLKEVIPIMQSEDQFKPGADPQKALTDLLEPKFASAAK